MKRSDEDIDRLLHDWHRIAATAQPPATTGTRRTVSTGSAAAPASLLALVVVAIVGVTMIGRSEPGPAASPSASGVAVAGTLPAPVSARVTANDFRLILTAGHAAVQAGEVIDASATVEFLGPEATREVQHASAAVVFSVREVDGPRHVDGGARLLRTSTTFERASVVPFPWSKSGSPDGPDTIDGYFEGDRLRLPVGTWELEAVFAERLTATLRVAVVPAGDLGGLHGTPIRSSNADDRFSLALAADGSVYREGDPINASATVTYGGPEAEVTLGDVVGPLTFAVAELGGDRATAPVARLGGCDTMAFRAGEPITVAWQRAGGTTTDDEASPQGLFERLYLDSPEFVLPAGRWRLTATLAGAETPFDLLCGGTPRHDLPVSIELTVLPGPTAEATPALEPTAAPEVNPPVRCGSLDPGDCENAIGLVAPLEPEAMLTSHAIVAADACEPGEDCPTRFRAIVAFLLPEEGRWRAYLVTGVSGPETVEAWKQPPPEGVTTLIEEGADLPDGGVLVGIPTLAPTNTWGNVECPALLQQGTLVEHPRWGLAIDDGAGSLAVRVRWPFGASALHQAGRVSLVDLTGGHVAGVGDELAVGACGDVEVMRLADDPTPTPSAGSGELVAEDTVTKDPFELRLSVTRTTFTAGEDIIPWASVTVMGEQGRVTVGHGGSPVMFSVREVDGEGREAIGGNDSMCQTSRWTVREPIPFPWQRGGSWSASNPTANDRFVQAYAENGPHDGMWLPAGTWELSATLDASVGDCGPSNPLTATIRIRVDEESSASPTPTPATARGPVVRCVRVDAEGCEGAVALARNLWPASYTSAELALVVDGCRPNTDCDRQYPFDAYVVFLPRAGVATGATVLVHGIDGPEVAEPTETAAMLTDELNALAEQGFDGGDGATLFQVRTEAPLAPGETHACPAASISGTLAENAETGIGLIASGQSMGVKWPFGFAGRRDATGVSLVDVEGVVVGRVGESFTGGGQGVGGDPPLVRVCSY